MTVAATMGSNVLHWGVHFLIIYIYITEYATCLPIKIPGLPHCKQRNVTEIYLLKKAHRPIFDKILLTCTVTRTYVVYTFQLNLVYLFSNTLLFSGLSNSIQLN